MARYRESRSRQAGETLMPTLDTTDWLALRARIDTLVTDPVMPAFDPGALVTPPSDATGPLPFILLSDVPNDRTRVGINTSVPHIRSGTLLLTVQWPIAREVSHVQLREIAGQIAAHFPADTCMRYGQSRLRVTRDATALQPYVDGAYRVAAVRVPWTSLA